MHDPWHSWRPAKPGRLSRDYVLVMLTAAASFFIVVLFATS